MFQLYLICSENWFEACSVGKLKMYGEAMSRNTQIQKISSHTDPVFHPDSKSCLGNEIEAMSQKLLRDRLFTGSTSRSDNLTTEGNIRCDQRLKSSKESWGLGPRPKIPCFLHFWYQNQHQSSSDIFFLFKKGFESIRLGIYVAASWWEECLNVFSIMLKLV